MLIIGEKNIEECGNIHEHTASLRGETRRVIEIRINEQKGVTYDTLKETFVDGAAILRTETRTRRERQLTNPIAEGEEIPDGYKPDYAIVDVPEVIKHDLSAFCVAGDIVDHRDGTFTVYMGKKTETEELEEELAAAMLEGGNE